MQMENATEHSFDEDVAKSEVESLRAFIGGVSSQQPQVLEEIQLFEQRIFSSEWLESYWKVVIESRSSGNSSSAIGRGGSEMRLLKTALSLILSSKHSSSSLESKSSYTSYHDFLRLSLSAFWKMCCCLKTAHCGENNTNNNSSSSSRPILIISSILQSLRGDQLDVLISIMNSINSSSNHSHHDDSIEEVKAVLSIVTIEEEGGDKKGGMTWLKGVLLPRLLYLLPSLVENNSDSDDINNGHGMIVLSAILQLSSSFSSLVLEAALRSPIINHHSKANNSVMMIVVQEACDLIAKTIAIDNSLMLSSIQLTAIAWGSSSSSSRSVCVYVYPLLVALLLQLQSQHLSSSQSSSVHHVMEVESIVLAAISHRLHHHSNMEEIMTVGNLLSLALHRPSLLFPDYHNHNHNNDKEQEQDDHHSNGGNDNQEAKAIAVGASNKNSSFSSSSSDEDSDDDDDIGDQNNNNNNNNTIQTQIKTKTQTKPSLLPSAFRFLRQCRSALTAVMTTANGDGNSSNDTGNSHRLSWLPSQTPSSSSSSSTSTSSAHGNGNGIKSILVSLVVFASGYNYRYHDCLSLSYQVNIAHLTRGPSSAAPDCRDEKEISALIRQLLSLAPSLLAEDSLLLLWKQIMSNLCLLSYRYDNNNSDNDHKVAMTIISDCLNSEAAGHILASQLLLLLEELASTTTGTKATTNDTTAPAWRLSWRQRRELVCDCISTVLSLLRQMLLHRRNQQQQSQSLSLALSFRSSHAAGNKEKVERFNLISDLTKTAAVVNLPKKKSDKDDQASSSSDKMNEAEAKTEVDPWEQRLCAQAMAIAASMIVSFISSTNSNGFIIDNDRTLMTTVEMALDLIAALDQAFSIADKDKEGYLSKATMASAQAILSALTTAEDNKSSM